MYLQVVLQWSKDIKYNLVKPLPKGRNKYQRYIKETYNTLNEAVNNATKLLNDTSTWNEHIAKRNFNELYLLT